MLGGALVGLEACTPRIEVAPSDKPITINLNVKIDHEVRVKVDKELDQVLSDKSGLF
ncbi:MAG: YnbE family lipoprotein [Nitrospiraceae bacterium]